MRDRQISSNSRNTHAHNSRSCAYTTKTKMTRLCRVVKTTCLNDTKRRAIVDHSTKFARKATSIKQSVLVTSATSLAATAKAATANAAPTTNSPSFKKNSTQEAGGTMKSKCESNRQNQHQQQQQKHKNSSNDNNTTSTHQETAMKTIDNESVSKMMILVRIMATWYVIDNRVRVTVRLLMVCSFLS
jgi:hypothetical protein